MDKVHSNYPYIPIVTWNLTTKCNFACSYCLPHLHDGKFGFPDYDNALHFVKELSKTYNHIFFELVGGEPTLWPKLIEFLKEVQNYSNVTTLILTNGSRTNSWWQKYADAGLDKKTIFVFSYHNEFINDELYYKNLEIISEKHSVVSMMLMNPEKFYHIKALGERIQENLAVDVIYKPIREQMHNTNLIDGYTEDMLEILKRSPQAGRYDRSKFTKDTDSIVWPTKVLVDGEEVNWQKLIIEKKHSFKGWKCTAGTTRFCIDFDGTVYTCSEARYFDQTKSKFTLGNINNRDVKIINDYVICPAEYCPCKMDALAAKYKND